VRETVAVTVPSLRADCSRCTGLCCVATVFTISADFPIDKPAGTPCPHLSGDFRCDVHDRLRPLGFRGCSVFECFGAGQQLTQHTLPGHDWRDPDQAPTVFTVFSVLRGLHELLWLLREAGRWVESTAAPTALRARVESVTAELQELVGLDADALLGADTARWPSRVGEVLRDVSVHARSAGGRAGSDVVGAGLGADLGGADLMGRDLRGRDLARASVRGAYLIACDLRGAVLDRTDVLGADLRDADLRGADLARTLFLTQMQVNAARGDAATALPDGLDRPQHWAS
jgi:hypothetical protein